MNIQRRYLEQHVFQEVAFTKSPHSELNLIVIIPVCNEPALTHSLSSLYHAKKPKGALEVIIVINDSERSDKAVQDQNRHTIGQIIEFREHHENERFKIWYHYADSLPHKHAGVGLARKIAMDAAVSRFAQLDRNGIIFSFDADSTVAPNYFQAVEELFRKYSKAALCLLRFEHPLDGEMFEPDIYEAIVDYELHLRYYYQALRFAGHPYAYHTVGSSFAVRSETYCLQGGMNRRKAGEDFYFLQKVIPHAEVHELNGACVYPSARKSDRVPFGTGAAVKQIVNSGNPFLTYHFQAFIEIKSFIKLIPKFFNNPSDTDSHFDGLSQNFKRFLSKDEFTEKLVEIYTNSSGYETYEKRFFQWFNAFKVLKFLNHSHEHNYQKQPVQKMARSYLVESKINATIPDSSKEFLLLFRNLEKSDL